MTVTVDNEEVAIKSAASDPTKSDTANLFGITRREMLVVGSATLVTTLFADSPAGAQTPGATTNNGGTKPVYVPAGDDAAGRAIGPYWFVTCSHSSMRYAAVTGPCMWRASITLRGSAQ